MFTGIITDIGTVLSTEDRGDHYLRVQTSFDMAQVAMGASIACSGICLTVVDKGDDWFGVTLSQETLSLTTAGNWQKGTRLNLESALRMGDELGGHLLTGHIDGCGVIRLIEPANASHQLVIELPESLAPFIAQKGSVAVDGISLTVNQVEDSSFTVNIIPHTWEQTTLHEREAGDQINIEVDLMARYIERWMETRHAA